MIKIAVVDTETTGLDEKIHGPHQIAIRIYQGNDLVSCSIKEQKEFHVLPFLDQVLDPKALAVSGLNEAQVREKGIPPAQVKAEISAMLSRYVDKYNRKDKMFFMAYNASFDYKMIRGLWEKLGDVYFGSYFWWPYMDVMTLAGSYLMLERPSLPDFKLGTVASHLGIEVNKEAQHDASYDLDLCWKIFNTLRQGKLHE